MQHFYYTIDNILTKLNLFTAEQQLSTDDEVTVARLFQEHYSTKSRTKAAFLLTENLAIVHCVHLLPRVWSRWDLWSWPEGRKQAQNSYFQSFKYNTVHVLHTTYLHLIINI